jgi:hypothetical protein
MGYYLDGAWHLLLNDKLPVEFGKYGKIITKDKRK